MYASCGPNKTDVIKKKHDTVSSALAAEVRTLDLASAPAEMLAMAALQSSVTCVHPLISATLQTPKVALHLDVQSLARYTCQLSRVTSGEPKYELYAV